MYLRTPKRYQKQRRRVLSLRWLWLWILTPIVALGGWYIYDHRADIAPPVQEFIASIAQNAQDGIATMTAPTPLPTENPSRRLVVAEGAWAQGSIDEALREYEAILPALPNEVEPHYRYTFGLIMEGHDQEALAAAEQTVTADPYSADAWAVRSQALNANGRQGEAIASAMLALQLNPDSARATAFLAEAYFDSNQIERATSTVEDALEMDPNSFEALYVYGRIQAEANFDFQAGLEAFEQAYSIAPNMPYLGVEAALTQMVLEEVDAGYERLQSIVELNPGNTRALWALAVGSAQYYGDPNQALDYLSRCMESDPQNLTCSYYMGRVYFDSLGDNERARDAFMRTVEIGTTDPTHYLSAGRINIAFNRCPIAVPLLREGYELAQAQTVPDTTQVTAFEEALGNCGAFTPAVPDGEATPEATPDFLSDEG